MTLFKNMPVGATFTIAGPGVWVKAGELSARRLSGTEAHYFAPSAEVSPTAPVPTPEPTPVSLEAKVDALRADVDALKTAIREGFRRTTLPEMVAGRLQQQEATSC